MPCFNSAPYVKESIISVVNNTIFDDCELIIVNDGSTDESEEIIHSIMETNKANNIFYKKIHNSGVSTARNTGIKMAKGKYLAFIDSDDVYSPTFLYNMLNCYNLLNCELSFCFYSVSNNLFSQNSGKLKMISKKSFCDILLYRKKKIGLWTTLFKKEIIDEYNISFPNGIKYGEDISFLWNYFFHCNSFCCVEKPMYFYRQVKSSAMKKDTIDKTQVMDVYEKVQKMSEQLYPKYANKIRNYCFPRAALALQKDYAKGNNKELFDLVLIKYKKLKYRKLLFHGRFFVRLASLTYIISPILFFEIFKKL